MNISLPLGTLGFFTDKVSKWMFLPTYRVSHSMHLERSRAGQYWKELGKHFEFDVHLENNYLSNETVPMSYLILKNLSEVVYERVEVLVTAEAEHARYQDLADLRGVGEIPEIIKLPRIPLMEVDITEDGKLLTAYKDVTVQLWVWEVSSGSLLEHAKSFPVRPTYTEFLNSVWDKRWGHVWNLDLIDSLKTDFRNLMQWYFLTRNRHRVQGEPNWAIYRLYKVFRLLCGLPLYSLLSHDRVLPILFWTPVVLRLRSVRPKSVEQFEEA